jgi:hypothetical protein
VTGTGAPPFVILAMPRSRSAWLARLLTIQGWVCGHDQLRYCRSLEDVSTWFSQPCIGTVETAGAPWWRLLQPLAPGVQVATLHRPVGEVVESFARKGWPVDQLGLLTTTMRGLERKLEQIAARLPNVLVVESKDLSNLPTCQTITRHCMGVNLEPEWHRVLTGVNVQIDLEALFRYCYAYGPQLTKLIAQAKHRTIAGMRPERAAEFDGMTFQQESLDVFLRDGVHLFREHSQLVGESPDSYLAKNIPLHQKLEAIGALMITTARANGRMFGYLGTVIGPSFEAENELAAIHTTFFASPVVKNLGIKLQRAALAELATRGVAKVNMRAGVRGSGPRLGAIYRRLGAEPDGQMYGLRLAG